MVKVDHTKEVIDNIRYLNQYGKYVKNGFISHPKNREELDRIFDEFIKAKDRNDTQGVFSLALQMMPDEIYFHGDKNATKRDTREKRILMNSIETEILDVASLYNEVTTSDLQGIAMAKANTIFELVKKFLEQEE
jgi:hypothetical protein